MTFRVRPSWKTADWADFSTYERADNFARWLACASWERRSVILVEQRWGDDSWHVVTSHTYDSIAREGQPVRVDVGSFEVRS